MKLTGLLLRWKKPLPKGNIYRGKYRLVKPVTPLDMAKQRAAFELEEKNMFYLRHPYLTAEQTYHHDALFNEKKKEVEKAKEERLKKFKKHRLLGDRFGFLKIADRWE